MWIEIPAPIQLIDPRTDEPMKVAGKMVDSRTFEAKNHEPESFYIFADERLAAQASTFREQRLWVKILDKLARAEEERKRTGIDPWADLDDVEYKLLKDKMEALNIGGQLVRQFMPFMDAVEDAKRQRPAPVLAVPLSSTS